MKTFTLNLMIFCAMLLAFSSCQKDQDNVTPPQDAETIVGTWDVVRADAVAYVDGYRIDDIEVETDGTLRFDADGKGVSDFTMTFMEETSEARGNFTWEKDGFEIIVNDGEEELRYAIITDRPNDQELQVTYEDEDGNEVEFTFVLKRIR